MKSFDNLAALTYLKNKLHKWKNIALLLAFFSIVLLLRLVAGGGLSEGFGGDYIADVKINGVIFEDDDRSEILAKVAEENSIKAVIVNIDSPGGGIVGSEILFNDLRKIAEKKPMVVLMGSVAASGGYMAAVASDHIIAYNGTLTGSIGVLMQAAEVIDLASKLGIKFNTYKSSPLKGSPSPFERSNFLVDKVIKDSISDSYSFFVELVKERRGQKLNKLSENEIFDGRVFTGRQALKAGLIDEIGGKDQAVAYLEKSSADLKGLPLHEVSIIKDKKGFLEKVLGFLPFGNESKSFNKQIMAIIP